MASDTGRGAKGGRSPTNGPAIPRVLKASPNSRINHLVIELFGNLDVWTTDQTRPFDSEEVYQLHDPIAVERARECEQCAVRSTGECV